MAIYVALLRGINVGGHNKVKMADLKKMFESLGFDSVQTYIQSGNVLFSSSDDEQALRERIERAFAETFGFSSTIVLRTHEELAGIVAGLPYTEQMVAEANAASEAFSLYVAMLPEAPLPEAVERLRPYENDKERFHVAGRDIYLLFHHSVRDAKLSANLQKLKTPATVRNWNTMNKLVALAQTIKESE